MGNKNRTNLEVNNDKLIIWQYITGPLSVIAGGILVIIIVIALLVIPDKINEKREAERKAISAQTRQTIVESFISDNPKTFGTIEKSYWDGSVYHLKSSEYGDFAINFVNDEIFNVELTNKANQTKEIYRKK